MQNSEQTELSPSTTSTTPKNNPISMMISIIALVIALIAIFLAIFTFVQNLKLYYVEASTERLNQNVINARLQTTAELQQLQSRLRQQGLQLADTQSSISRLLRLSSHTELQRILGTVSYLLHLANLQLTIAHDNEACLKLLETAQSRLRAETNPALFNLKYAVGNAISALKSAPRLDLSDLMIRLDNLNQAIRQIPMIPTAPKATAPSKLEKEKVAMLPWYERMWHQLGGLKDLIVIRHLQKPVMPLLSPQEINFLKENINLKLSQTQWAAMYQMPEIYQKNLELIKKWVNTYYQNQDPKIIQKINEQIDALLKINIKPSSPSLDNALQALQEAERISAVPAPAETTPQTPAQEPAQTPSQAPTPSQTPAPSQAPAQTPAPSQTHPQTPAHPQKTKPKSTEETTQGVEI